uniref:Uncharacterized protein n=1 Tax=Tanacetum cinerariifolium TaxID=118510 RepID=A0A6L2MY13_TANCI|nr:hypothetical protein [Tanacetum cinerariifolium]
MAYTSQGSSSSDTKTGLGYDSQMNKSDLNDVHVNESQVIGNSLIDSHESDGEDNQVNDRSSAPIIKEWESESEDENVVEKTEVKKTVKPSLEKIKFVNARNTTTENKSKAEKPRKLRQSLRKFVPAAVLIKSRLIPVNAAKESSHRATALASATMHVNTIAPKPYSPIDRVEPFNDVYVTPAHTKKVFTNMKRKNRDFLGTVTPLFASMLVPQVVEGAGSGQPSELQPPSLAAPPSHKEHAATVGNEAVYIGEDDRVVRAATTVTSLEAKQESGTQTRFKTASKKSYDPPLSEVNTSGSGEGRMEHHDDLIDFVPPSPYDSPHLEVMGLQKKVKRIKRKLKARTPGMMLFQIGIFKRKSFDKENVSKQGRNLNTRLMFEESDFVPMDSEVVKDNGKKDESSNKQAGSKKKREGLKLKPKSPKKVKVMKEQEFAIDEQEKEEFRLCLKIVQDEVWRNQHEWSVISWNLYEYYGVHTLLLDDTLVSINMLVEKKYPLTKEMHAIICLVYFYRTCARDGSWIFYSSDSLDLIKDKLITKAEYSNIKSLLLIQGFSSSSLRYMTTTSPNLT